MLRVERFTMSMRRQELDKDIVALMTLLAFEEVCDNLQ